MRHPGKDLIIRSLLGDFALISLIPQPPMLTKPGWSPGKRATSQAGHHGRVPTDANASFAGWIGAATRVMDPVFAKLAAEFGNAGDVFGCPAPCHHHPTVPRVSLAMCFRSYAAAVVISTDSPAIRGVQPSDRQALSKRRVTRNRTAPRMKSGSGAFSVRPPPPTTH